MRSGPRRWLEVSVRSPAEEEAPLLVEGLLALGGRAAEEREGRYVTHVEAPPDPDAWVAEAAHILREITGQEVEVEVAWREHEAWEETWRRGLGPRRVTDRILVRPSWVAAPPEGPEVEIVLDPGMAFGTAEHGTTRGCLRLLDRTVRPGDRILDVGSGSGILSIAAVLLGAAEVQALEADALACEALAENLERNGVAGRVRLVQGVASAADVAARGPVAGVVANIETSPLRALLPGFAGALRAGGWLIVSGIQAHEWEDMERDTAAAGFELVELDGDGEWRSALFRRV